MLIDRKAAEHKRNVTHSGLQCLAQDRMKGTVLIDLGSKAGTVVDNIRLTPYIPHKVRPCRVDTPVRTVATLPANLLSHCWAAVCGTACSWCLYAHHRVLNLRSHSLRTCKARSVTRTHAHTHRKRACTHTLHSDR